MQELEELVEREAQIREELGLTQVPESSEAEPESTTGLLKAGGIETAELFGGARIASVDFAAVLSEEERNFRSIQSELGYLQASLTEKNSRYDSYLDTIEAKKEAERAEKERRARLRETIVNNALSYIGNAYVYGGNDPNTGVDCSGFTRYILSHAAGVYLNRTAAAQSSQGRTVSAENARPGDLVFYSNGSSINHVAIYIGNGQVVHASNERVGITKSNMYYRTPAKIVNVLGD
ncbi:MAG: C40 family peptidase [Lachnospiraceae bacterium]|nr:C40 family peptidase [Lachnospiraceae bacterium]